MNTSIKAGNASRKAKLVILSISLTLTLIFSEVALRIFVPYNLGATGHWAAPNALKYGWGYNPKSSVRILDPDTGDLHVYRMNDKGWHDRDHSFLKKKGIFRILILGDSVTFGAIVPPQKIYPRVLEKLFQDAGQAVEVISMGYGGWGTDQQLEALKKEGIHYKPDLVICQFTDNDLQDNLFYKAESKRMKKPFSYHIEDGLAVRRKIPGFNKPKNTREWFKHNLQKSEILKRLYGAYLSQAMKEAPIKEFEYDQSHLAQDREFFAGKNQLRHLQLVLGESEHGSLLEAFNVHAGKDLSFTTIQQILKSANFSGDQEMILRILEKRWFKDFWNPEGYLSSKKPNPESEAWQLYFGILAEMKKTCTSKSIPLVVFCQEDLESYEWATSWFMTPRNEETQSNHELLFELIEQFANKTGFSVVPQTRKYSRARNDPHPSSDGHDAMARDIMDFVVENYASSIGNVE